MTMMMMMMIFSIVVDSTTVASSSVAPVSSCRNDSWLWPFSVDSIWNTPIGTGAHYLPARLYNDSAPFSSWGPPFNIHIDQEWLINSDDPAAEVKNASWVNDAGAFPAPDCGGTQQCCTMSPSSLPPVVDFLPLPTRGAAGSGAFTDCVPNNNGAAVLLPSSMKKHTIVQMQPYYRSKLIPANYSFQVPPFYSWYRAGAPTPTPFYTSLLGDGALGAHGGSGLSVLGGSVRRGDIVSSGPIRHALKIELWSGRYMYGLSKLQTNATADNGNGTRMQYVWPAVGSDTCSAQLCADPSNPHPQIYCGVLQYLAPGSLLAIRPQDADSIASKLKTSLARDKLLPALTNYGAYIVDSTGSQSGGASFCSEPAVIDEIKRLHNIDLSISNPVRGRWWPGAKQASEESFDFYDDFVLIFRKLHVVANNAKNRVGGGGEPIAPRAPEFCPEVL